ncbi:MAG: cyclopropane fatty acyl phospholipid synthase [bacterium]|nr:cyclopropane fatty acyl phospholipid synthase [bacterium]
MTSKATVEELLKRADIAVNGDAPWDIRVHDERFYDRVLSEGSLGLGESYLDGWWDVPRLDEFFCRVLAAGLDRAVASWRNVAAYLRASLVNLQSRRRGTRVAREHYDLSPALYESFLDPYNQYTCGYFKDTNDLNVAQERKLDLICRKLHLVPADRVLDIGCGWGGFAKYAAERFGCRVVGITISDEQAKYAQAYTGGLPVEIRKQDYRDLSGTFDKVLVCGMIEHVGYKNYRRIMEIVREHLTANGLFLLHTIGGNKSVTHTDSWINRYIFPNSMVPSVHQLAAAAEGLFTTEDWHNFSASYDKTLMAWHRNFTANWGRIKDGYDERFRRMWTYYLLSSAGSFRARKNQLWQIVLSPYGVPGGYQSVR